MFYIAVSPEFTGYAKTAADIGSVAELTCEVYSYPFVDDIAFYLTNELIETDDTKTVSALVYVNDNGFIKQQKTIIFNSVTSLDYTEYTCKAINAKGMSEQQLTLQAPSK